MSTCRVSIALSARRLLPVLIGGVRPVLLGLVISGLSEAPGLEGGVSFQLAPQIPSLGRIPVRLLIHVMPTTEKVITQHRRQPLRRCKCSSRLAPCWFRSIGTASRGSQEGALIFLGRSGEAVGCIEVGQVLLDIAHYF